MARPKLGSVGEDRIGSFTDFHNWMTQYYERQGTGVPDLFFFAEQYGLISAGERGIDVSDSSCSYLTR